MPTWRATSSVKSSPPNSSHTALEASTLPQNARSHRWTTTTGPGHHCPLSARSAAAGSFTPSVSFTPSPASSKKNSKCETPSCVVQKITR